MKSTYAPIYQVTLKVSGEIVCRKGVLNAKDIFVLVKEYLGPVDREHLAVVLLSTANKLIGINTVSIGSLSSSIVHPREVFKPAVLANASAIILVHNHLGGENIPVPSNEDQNITQLIKLAGEALQIKLLDHVIISETGYYSFNENGLI